MIDTQLNHRVLLDNHLHEHRLVASVPIIELHRLIIGINAVFLNDISITTEGDRFMARGHSIETWSSNNKGDELYSRSFAKHEFAVEDLQLLVTQAFLNGILLKIRKFGVEGGRELVHFFVSNDARITTDNIINELSVLIPPNFYHKNPVNSWTRMNPQPGIRMPQKDKSLFNEADVYSSRRQVSIPLEVFRNMPKGNNVLVKSNGEDRWRFRNVNDKETLIEVQREDWFRVLYRRNVNAMGPEDTGDSFSAENLPELSERALTVLADRAVHRSSNDRWLSA